MRGATAGGVHADCPSEGPEELVGEVAQVQEGRLGLLLQGGQLLDSRGQDVYMAFVASTCVTHTKHRDEPGRLVGDTWLVPTATLLPPSMRCGAHRLP